MNPDDYGDFATRLGPLASQAHTDPDLADAYWRARRQGHPHPSLTALTSNLGNARSPIALVIHRLRNLGDKPPTATKRRPPTHYPCTNQHHDPNCEICSCDPNQPATHHVPTPMPDWFRAQWRQAAARITDRQRELEAP